tara:strand:+ start:2435 stop:3652 length:1218 start_codon:yes stop_codon:yes gene_type:complete
MDSRETVQIENPKDDGRSAKEFLEYHGYVGKRPAIRSSDYELSLSNPFQYYLSRRMGFIPCLQWSEALSHGSWFHTYLEFIDHDQAIIDEAYMDSLRLRKQELDKICDSRGIKGESKDKVLSREEKSAMEAKAWAEALWMVPMSNNLTAYQYLKQDHFMFLDTELHVKTKEKYPRAATFDALLYHKKQNSLWIVDYKTTSMSVQNRLMTCPVEFQTNHYLFILKYCKEDIARHFNLPEDVKVGGMIHIAIEKPTIKFGIKDRDFQYTTKTLSRGPRKGQTITEKIYSGEPKLKNYIDRCRDWYTRTGDFEGVEKTTPVSYSICKLENTEREQKTYQSQIEHIQKLIKCECIPSNFLKATKSLFSFGRQNPYLPFYLCPVELWPNIIKEEGFIQHDRDKETRFLLD